MPMVLLGAFDDIDAGLGALKACFLGLGCGYVTS